MAIQQATVIAKKGHSISDGQNITVKLDVVPKETHDHSSTITSHPVEEGMDISDGTRDEPDALSLECLISNTPLGESPDASRSQNARDQLLTLKSSGKLLTVLTTLGPYTSMLIEHVSVTRDAPTYNALSFTVSFKKIIVVQNTLTRARVSKDNRTPKLQDTGEQTPEDPDPIVTTKGADTMDAGKKLFGLK
jgi:hypothetical protein